MFKKLLGKLIGKVVKSDAVADAIADKADDMLMDVADAHTIGLASEVEGVVKRTKARKKAAKSFPAKR
jgi:hypothetical protein